MPAYHVERSITIDAPREQVRPAIEDFNQWPSWSPWLCMEPDAKRDVFGTPGETGHGYDWDGELVGAGQMKIASASDDQIKMDLSFQRPFKSTAKVMMEIKPVGSGQTQVTWHMDGKMPFFLFFMIGMMKRFIGMDYERGLKMMKEYVETGKVNSKTEIIGIVDVPQMHYLAVEARCSMADIGESMGETMPAVHQCAGANNAEVAGPPGALYHDCNLKKQTFHYSVFVPTKSLTNVDGANAGTIAPCRAVKIVHTGSYKHLGNAWTTAMQYHRFKKVKLSKKQCGFEIYTSDPTETPEEEIVTEIYVPIRG